VAEPFPRALVVDDDAAIRLLVRKVLEQEGWRVDEASDGRSALGHVDHEPPDLVILDVMMPDTHGLDVLAHLRVRDDIPVILLTAMGAESDRIRGLDLGADDYIVKPFSPGEFAARVRSVVRRAKRGEAGDLIDHGDLAIDLKAREVRARGQLVETTAKEFDLLAFLAQSPRQVFSRGQLLEHVWGSSSDWQDPATVTEHVRRIRRKIEEDPDHPKWLLTVRGVGYRFEP
jgi:two-component system, OmpR family, phosphate regulon response regulator PhoB